MTYEVTGKESAAAISLIAVKLDCDGSVPFADTVSDWMLANGYLISEYIYKEIERFYVSWKKKKHSSSEIKSVVKQMLVVLEME